MRFITLAGGGPAGEDHLSPLWISGSLARVSPLWLSADLPPLGDRVLVRVHPGRDRDRRADASSGPPMTPSTAADGSDQDQAGDGLVQNKPRRRSMESALGVNPQVDDGDGHHIIPTPNPRTRSGPSQRRHRGRWISRGPASSARGQLRPPETSRARRGPRWREPAHRGPRLRHCYRRYRHGTVGM